MNRRISLKRKLAIDRIEAYSRHALWNGNGTGAWMIYCAKAGGAQRHARSWILATGEFPTGVHKVPWRLAGNPWDSAEIDFDLFQPSSLPRGASGPVLPKYGKKAAKAAVTLRMSNQQDDENIAE